MKATPKLDRKLAYKLTETRAKTGAPKWLYRKEPRVSILERKMQSGTVAYRINIPGVITGRRIKPVQRPSLEEAVAFIEDELARYQRHGQGKALTPAQNVDAVESFKLLSGTGLKLRRVVEDYMAMADECAKREIDVETVFKAGLTSVCPDGGRKTVAEVVDEIMELKAQAKNLRGKTTDSARQLAGKIRSYFGTQYINQVTKADLVGWLLSVNLSSRTRLNYRNAIGEVMRYAKQQSYISRNPLESITVQERHAILGVDSEEGNDINILTVEQAERLMRTAAETHHTPHGNRIIGLAPAVALGLFCGLRTGEIKRLKWDAVDFEKRLIKIAGEVAKKRTRRFVEIGDTALAWLFPFRRDSGKVVEDTYKNDYTKRFKKLQRLAGFGETGDDGTWFSTWKENWMRHSYATYYFGVTDSAEKAAVQLGHTGGINVFLNHYRGLATKEAAMAYFAILPEPTSLGVIPFAAS